MNGERAPRADIMEVCREIFLEVFPDTDKAFPRIYSHYCAVSVRGSAKGTLEQFQTYWPEEYQNAVADWGPDGVIFLWHILLAISVIECSWKTLSELGSLPNFREASRFVEECFLQRGDNPLYGEILKHTLPRTLYRRLRQEHSKGRDDKQKEFALIIHSRQVRAWVFGVEHQITGKAFKLLSYLCALKPDTVVTYDELLEKVWEVPPSKNASRANTDTVRKGMQRWVWPLGTVNKTLREVFVVKEGVGYRVSSEAKMLMIN